MQKKFIALAVAGLVSGAAFAQSNVTVYGVLDVQQAWVKSSGATNGINQGNVGRLDAHANYIGFKGTEALGNGLTALFTFESAINTDQNSTGNAFGGRDAYVGLTGGFGTVVGGTLTHPLRAMGAKVELLPGAAGFGTMSSVTGTIAGVKTGADDRAQNAVAYVSPSFSGFSATVAYINGENKTNTVGAVEGVNQKAYQIAAQYENGPLFVALGYHKASDFSATGVPVFASQDAKVIRAAATYSLPTNTKLTALYDQTKVENFGGGVNAPEIKRNAWSIGAAQTFGQNVIGLEYARSGNVKVSNGPDQNNGANIWTAMYGYNLSKRTMLHARYSKLNNDGAGTQGFYYVPVSNGVASGAGADYAGFSLGLRHSF